jgi:hypothetical protein
MGNPSVLKFLKEIGSRGGKARAKALSAKERRAIATKASKAAAKARTRAAKERKTGQSEKFSK